MAFLIDQLNNSGLFAQSAYSAGIATCDSDGNIITATYLSSVDLTPYQTTAGMTAYATTGDIENKLDTTSFSDVSGTFLTAHQSLDGYATTAWVDSQGYLTAHQPISADEWNNVYDTVNVYSGSWTGSESSPTASVDSNGSIDIVSSNNTVYFDVNGTWFNNAVNSALPTSAVKWNSNYDTVNTNSGVWGGSALNISAGEGVKVTLVNNNLVFSTDETVLWSGSLTWGQTAALSDSVKNYDRIRFYIEETNRHRKATNELVLTDLSNANLREFALNMQDATTAYFGNYFTVYDINEAGDSLTSVSGRQWWYNPWTATNINGTPDRGLILTRVIGINRINNV